MNGDLSAEEAQADGGSWVRFADCTQMVSLSGRRKDERERK